MTTEHFFTKQNPPANDGRAVTSEVARRARYLFLIHGIDYQAAVEAALIADPGLEAKYSQLGDAPIIPSRGGIGEPTLEAE